MTKDPAIFLNHILESISNIEEFSKDLSKEQLLKDKKTQSAIIRQIEIIGEAVKNLPKSFTSKNPQVEWASIARTRDKLIHHYFGVNLETIWDIIWNELPKLRKDIQEIIEKDKENKQ